METLILFVIIPLILIVFIGLVMARLYRRATREVSLVKTGSGGKQIIMDGGTIAIPLLHEISLVNMKTLRLEVMRHGDQALITQDRMRVDVAVEFYVSVNATVDGIARAAQTLGDKTFNVDALREMIEGKLIDGLRAVAARMTMDGLHENRSDFVQEVQNAVSEDLLKNGLELESVSLTALDQTPFEHLDENNAFNAVGMRKLAEVIAKSKKERAEIDADAEVSVRRSAMEAEKLKYQIQQEEEGALIAQIQEIETMKAAQDAEIAKRRETSEQAKEQARIAREQEVRASEIARERAIREAEITKERELEVANQERQIIISQKSEEESRAAASADAARAEATKASEAIETARALAVAQRAKETTLIEAAQDAERAATRIRIEAETERAAAEDRAEARREEARAEADAVTITAEAKKMDLLAEAEGRRALVEAENAIADAIAKMKVDLARLEAMPKIVAEMVRPAEKIDSIKIHQIGGLTGGAGGGFSGGDGAGKPVVNQALDSILGMAVQMPALKKLGEELGVSLEDGLAGVTGAIDASTAPQDPQPETEVLPPEAEATTASKPRGKRPRTQTAAE